MKRLLILLLSAWHGALGIVGAYPQGSDPDTCPGVPKDKLDAPLPASDPVHRAGGPLFIYWRT